ncbi:AbiV family abortive infection protein [Glycomyces sambucus]|uniref:AbiV family abortive infection protein n=1 Tax=Glycomyces sambucus TaxID=380244 RepID=UPI000B87955F|nr:AbiV family abortive infection protein [Glycomyces sambucus]
MARSEPEEISAAFARQWWKALLANAVALIEDAAVLAEHQSPGRAQALVVLAMEELAKARWLYQAAEHEWTAPLGMYGLPARPARSVMVPEGLRTVRRPHGEKLQVAEQFASGLAGFWNSTRRHEYYTLPDLETFEATAKQRNLDKQAGLYVDRAATSITSPLDVPSGEVEGDIRRAAQVIQMHLIEDHTRQQDATEVWLIDSAEGMHWAVMPYAQPEEFTSFVERLSERAPE